MVKRWNILTADEKKVEALSAALGISPALCSLLVHRGVETYEAAHDFFRPKLSDLYDPYLMKDMDKAVKRITQAIDDREKIMVYGDYDVDGTTSVACMYRFLCSIYEAVLLDYYIPHRYREGYGISKAGIDFAAEYGFSLIVALDCGIKSVELVAYAKSLGIDFIICDHHLPDTVIPNASAILNPKQADCPYPYKELCGCGVGFKLMTALADHFGMDDIHLHQYLDLLATAIAADIVPMTGENRILAFHGLAKINQDPSPGIKALIHLGNIREQLTITNVVFVIAPRVNAAGRMDDARKAVQLFIAPDYESALELAKLLHQDNTDRKVADSSITNEALEIINADPLSANRKTTVVFRDHWHKGVVGIVASRLIETHFRPTVVLTQNEGIVAGSARSVPGFNLYEAIHACREHLLGYGGHFAAAGLSLLPEQVLPFSNKFEAVVSETIDERLLVPEIIIDSPVHLSQLTPSFYNILCQMEPFGPGNMRPVFIARGVSNNGHSKILKELHIRFVVTQGNTTLQGIGFNMADKFPLLDPGQQLDLVFTLDQNEWNGNTSLQLKVIDLRSSNA